MKFLVILELFLFSHHIESHFYHNGEEIREMLKNFATHYSEIAEIETLGFSETLNLPILALKIGKNKAVKVLFTGIHHAEEVLGAEVILRLADTL